MRKSDKFLQFIKELEYDKIGKFKLIEDNYSTHDVYILEDETVKTKINELFKLLSAIQEEERDQKSFSEQRLVLEKLKKQLTQYKISLNEKEYEKIKDFVETEDNQEHSFYPYISLKAVQKIYQEDIPVEKLDFF